MNSDVARAILVSPIQRHPLSYDCSVEIHVSRLGRNGNEDDEKNVMHFLRTLMLRRTVQH